MILLGDEYSETDEDELFWFKKSAEKGNVLGQYYLGDYYYLDADNSEESAKWYRKAINNGYLAAQEDLADVLVEEDKDSKTMRLFGDLRRYGQGGIFEDKLEAVDAYEDAAELGDIVSQFNLGEMYYHGEGDIFENKKEGLKWYKKAAKLGHIQSQQKLRSLGERW